METKKMNKRMLVIATTLFSIVLLMGMNVSGTITYTHAKQLNTDTIKQKIDTIINSTEYQKLYDYVHPKFIKMYNDTEQQTIYQSIITNMSPYFTPYFDKGPLYPGLVLFLQLIGESVMLLMGHGVFGMGTAVLVVLSVDLMASIGIGILDLPRLSYLITVMTVGVCIGFIDDIMLYNIGIIGTLLVIAIGSPLIAMFLLFAIPVGDIVLMIVIFLDTLDYT